MGAGGPSSGTGDSKSVTTQKAQKDLEVSAYEREIEKQKAKAKAKSKVTTGTLSDPKEKDDTAAKMDLFINDPYTKKQGGPLILRPAEPLFDAGAKKTRQYFSEKVLGKGAYKGTSRQKFETMSRSAQESMYKDYITGRSSGKTDAYGREIKSTGNGNQVVQAPPVATIMPVKGPTEAEVSQIAPEVTAEEARARANELISKKRRRGRGRSLMVLTSPQGLTNEGLTLSKKTLLG